MPQEQRQFSMQGNDKDKYNRHVPRAIKPPPNYSSQTRQPWGASTGPTTGPLIIMAEANYRAAKVTGVDDDDTDEVLQDEQPQGYVFNYDSHNRDAPFTCDLNCPSQPQPCPCPSLPCLGHGSGSAGQWWTRVIKGSFLYGSSGLLGPGFQGNFKKEGKYLTRDLFTLPCPSLPPGLPCPYHQQHTTSSPTNLYNYLIKYY
jgi:hypothetical protein